MTQPLVCKSFNGDDGFIDLGTIPIDHDLQLYNTDFSMSVWIKSPLDGDQFSRIADKSDGGNASNGWQFHVQNNGSVVFGISGGTDVQTSSGVVPVNIWTHIVATKALGSAAAIYINGVLSASGTGAGRAAPNVETNMRIGSWNHSTGKEFTGLMHDFRIYDRLTSNSEILGLSDISQAWKVALDPVAWWKMEENVSTIYDSIGTNNGTISGGVTVATGAQYSFSNEVGYSNSIDVIPRDELFPKFDVLGNELEFGFFYDVARTYVSNNSNQNLGNITYSIGKTSSSVNNATTNQHLINSNTLTENVIADTYSYYTGTQDIQNTTGTNDGYQELDDVSYSIFGKTYIQQFGPETDTITIDSITGSYQNRFEGYTTVTDDTWISRTVTHTGTAS